MTTVTDAAEQSGDPEIALRTRNLTKKFGGFLAVDQVDLTIRRGEFRSIIGPNGAGKTTLFNLISGAMDPTGGRILLDDEDVTDYPPNDRVTRGLGRSFQLTDILSGLTVRENIRIGAQSKMYPDLSVRQSLFATKDALPEITHRTETILERIGLVDRAETPASSLAYGDRRKLEIGIVLATDPEVVMLDEPTAGMSIEETNETMALIQEVLDDQTLLLIEHDIDLVMDLSDRITVLHRGQVLREGTPSEVATDPDVKQAYLGDYDS
jgi:branched-chain amino acid transport system ATP-binding protein